MQKSNTKKQHFYKSNTILLFKDFKHNISLKQTELFISFKVYAFSQAKTVFMSYESGVLKPAGMPVPTGILNFDGGKKNCSNIFQKCCYNGFWISCYQSFLKLLQRFRSIYTIIYSNKAQQQSVATKRSNLRKNVATFF